MRSRTTPIRSACVKRSNESGGGKVIHSLNHTFPTLTPPPARKFAPITAFMRERQQADHGATGKSFAEPHEQGLERQRVGSAGKELVAIDEIEQRHRLAAEGM